jgi:hypothetical protein
LLDPRGGDLSDVPFLFMWIPRLDGDEEELEPLGCL